jgi:hypothetical protein
MKDSKMKKRRKKKNHENPKKRAARNNIQDWVVVNKRYLIIRKRYVSMKTKRDQYQTTFANSS